MRTLKPRRRTLRVLATGAALALIPATALADPNDQSEGAQSGSPTEQSQSGGS